MKFSYFPGCTLKNKAKELDIYARRCAEKLGVTLEELDEWQCCGGVYASSDAEIATKLSAVRALAHANAKGTDIVTVCSACHNVLKQTAYELNNNAEFALKVKNYMLPEQPDFSNVRAVHYLELLRDTVGFDRIRQATVNPLGGMRVAAYYGCLLLRPGKIMQMDDPENPHIMEELIRSVGGEPVIYAYRNECCGGYVTLEAPEQTDRICALIHNSARVCGAEVIVTACPLCYYNLRRNPDGLPVVYFTELLAQALGVKENSDG